MWAVFAYPLYFLAIYVLVLLSLLAVHYAVPTSPKIVVFIARSMVAYLALLICAVYGTIASLLLKPLNQHHAYAQWTTARSFKYIGGAMMGVQFKILGNGEKLLSQKRPMVILGNHQTELDILLLGSIWPQHTSVTSKQSLKNIPFLGWFMTLSGTVFIDRVDRSQAMKAFEGAARAMRELKQNVFIFPEGTRSYSAEPGLLPFKKGAFHLAVQAQADILPVVAENYSRVLNVKARRFVPGTVRVKVLDPVSTKGLTAADVDQLTLKVRNSMLEAIMEMAKNDTSRTLPPAEAKKLS